jgi:hypothetical protein
LPFANEQLAVYDLGFRHHVQQIRTARDPGRAVGLIEDVLAPYLYRRNGRWGVGARGRRTLARLRPARDGYAIRCRHHDQR